MKTAPLKSAGAKDSVYIQKIEIIFKILTLWAAGSATARQSFGLEYFGQASFNLLRQGRLSLDYLGTY